MGPSPSLKRHGPPTPSRTPGRPSRPSRRRVTYRPTSTASERGLAHQPALDTAAAAPGLVPDRRRVPLVALAPLAGLVPHPRPQPLLFRLRRRHQHTRHAAAAAVSSAYVIIVVGRRCHVTADVISGLPALGHGRQPTAQLGRHCTARRPGRPHRAILVVGVTPRQPVDTATGRRQ